MTLTPRSNWRSNLAPTCPQPLQQEQRRLIGIALRPTRRPVRQMHKTEGYHEPACSDQYGRDVSQPVRAEADERLGAHPPDAGGCPDWMKAPTLARRLRHLLSEIRVRTWSVWWSRRWVDDYQSSHFRLCQQERKVSETLSFRANKLPSQRCGFALTKVMKSL